MSDPNNPLTARLLSQTHVLPLAGSAGITVVSALVGRFGLYRAFSVIDSSGFLALLITPFFICPLIAVLFSVFVVANDTSQQAFQTLYLTNLTAEQIVNAYFQVVLTRLRPVIAVEFGFLLSLAILLGELSGGVGCFALGLYIMVCIHAFNHLAVASGIWASFRTQDRLNAALFGVGWTVTPLLIFAVGLLVAGAYAVRAIDAGPLATPTPVEQLIGTISCLMLPTLIVLMVVLPVWLTAKLLTWAERFVGRPTLIYES